MNWTEADDGDHARLLELYRRLISLRRANPEPSGAGFADTTVEPSEQDKWSVFHGGGLNIAFIFSAEARHVPVGGDELLLVTHDGILPKSGIIIDSLEVPLTVRPLLSDVPDRRAREAFDGRQLPKECMGRSPAFSGHTDMISLVAKKKRNPVSQSNKEDVFSRFTTKTSTALGRPPVFIGAVAVLILWAVSGPVLGFSDTWQLIINTGTTIVTFLMVFIIQNTQNRDNLAINLKLEAMMLELKVTNTKLYGAEENGEKALHRQTRKLRLEADEQELDTADNAAGGNVAR